MAWFRREIVAARSASGRTSVAFPRLDRAHGYGIHQWNTGRRQRMGREPARLSCQRWLGETRAERGGDSSPEDQAGRRIPWQTGGAAPDARGQKRVFALAGEWKGQLSVDARPPHALPIGYENWPVMPSVLYEGMLAPIAPSRDHRCAVVPGRTELRSRIPVPQNSSRDDRRLAKALWTGRFPLLHRQSSSV